MDEPRPRLDIAPATPADLPLVAALIRELADTSGSRSRVRLTGRIATSLPATEQTMTRHPTHGAATTPMAWLIGTAWIAGTAAAGEPAAAPSPPTVQTPAAAAAQHATHLTPMTQEQLLQRRAQHPDPLFVLDVRTPEEFAAGHVPGAVNVPHDQIASHLAQVPKDQDVVLYCRSGRRVAIAADVLSANGYTRLSHLEGDMTAWVGNGRPVEK